MSQETPLKSPTANIILTKETAKQNEERKMKEEMELAESEERKAAEGFNLFFANA